MDTDGGIPVRRLRHQPSGLPRLLTTTDPSHLAPMVVEPPAIVDGPRDPPPINDDVDVVVRSVGHAPPRPRFIVPDVVEGVRVVQDLYSGPRSHHRIIVTCPLSGSLHLPACIRRHQITHRQCSHFGSAEPYGFIGCWLARAREFTTQADHKAYVPTTTEIEDYCKRHGWDSGVS